MNRLRLYVRLLVALLVLSVLAPVLVARADASFDRASAASSAERFDDAARELEALVLERGYSPGGLANLGSAYARGGQVGLAILALERARLLDPQDSQLRAKLAEVRGQAGVSAPSPTALEELASLWPARAWLMTGAVGLALFCLVTLVAGAVRRARSVAVLTALGAGLVTALSGAALFVGTLATDRAVVIGEDAIARVSPFDEADAVSVVRPGELVRVEETHGDYVRIVVPDGRQGWMATTLVERVVPR